jgi:hypothetical protein
MVMISGADLRDARPVSSLGAAIGAAKAAGWYGGLPPEPASDWRMEGPAETCAPDLRGTEWTGKAWRHPDGSLRRDKPDEVDGPMPPDVAEDGFGTRDFRFEGSTLKGTIYKKDRPEPPKFRVLDGTREDALDGLQASMQKNVDYWAERAAWIEVERDKGRLECAELRDKVADLRASRLDRMILGFTIGMALTAGASLLVWGPF